MHGTLAAVILCAALPSAGVQTTPISTPIDSRLASRIDAMPTADRERIALVLASSPDPAALVAQRPGADTDDDDCFIQQLEWLRCILSGKVNCGTQPDC